MSDETSWTLIGANGKPFQSTMPGTFGGYSQNKLYGRFDCRAALQAIARGGYVKHRGFFLDEASAVAAGYRPCSICMPLEYAQWKADKSQAKDPAQKTA